MSSRRGRRGSRRQQPGAVQVKCPGCGVTITTLDLESPLRSAFRPNSRRVLVRASDGRLGDRRNDDVGGEVDLPPVPRAWVGAKLDGASILALAEEALRALSQIPDGHWFGCDSCDIAVPVSLDDLTERLNRAVDAGERAVTLT